MKENMQSFESRFPPSNDQFGVGDRVTVNGAKGWIKELLSAKNDFETPDDLWVVVLKEDDGSTTEEHYFANNLNKDY